MTCQVAHAPRQLLEWTGGRALVATSNPLPEAIWPGDMQVRQCTSLLIFPGLALGAIASQARRITGGMLVAAAQALAGMAPAHGGTLSALYPPLSQAREVARQVALAVAAEAQSAGEAAPSSARELGQLVDALIWQPRYAQVRRV